MGVRWLLHWQWQAPGAPTRTAFEALHTVVQGLRGSQSGSWSATCTTLAPRPPQPQDAALGVRQAAREPARELYTLAFGDQPASLFLLLRQERCVVEAERGARGLLDRLDLYRDRLTLLFEGVTYALGDFVVRVGKAVLRPADELRGIFVDVEYKPLASQQLAAPVMEEFTALLAESASQAAANQGGLARVSAPLAEFGLADQYGHCHVAVQYAALATLLTAPQLRSGAVAQ